MEKIIKIRDGFIVKKIADEYIVVPSGKGIVDFKLMLTLNETGAWMWDKIAQGITKERLISDLLSEYEIDEETAISDIEDFIGQLTDKKLLEN